MITLVERLRLGGPNAYEVYGEAAAALESQAKLIGELYEIIEARTDDCNHHRVIKIDAIKIADERWEQVKQLNARIAELEAALNKIKSIAKDETIPTSFIRVCEIRDALASSHPSDDHKCFAGEKES